MYNIYIYFFFFTTSPIVDIKHLFAFLFLFAFHYNDRELNTSQTYTFYIGLIWIKVQCFPIQLKFIPFSFYSLGIVCPLRGSQDDSNRSFFFIFSRPFLKVLHCDHMPLSSLQMAKSGWSGPILDMFSWTNYPWLIFSSLPSQNWALNLIMQARILESTNRLSHCGQLWSCRRRLLFSSSSYCRPLGLNDSIRLWAGNGCFGVLGRGVWVLSV